MPAPRRRFWVSPGLVSLVQYLLILAGIATLLALLWRRASPGAFAAALLLAACLAALPSLLYSGVLPWRLSRRLERLRRTGVVASAQVISLPDPIPIPDRRRPSAGVLPGETYVEMPVRLASGDDPHPLESIMLVPLELASSLSPGARVTIRCDPAHPDLVLYDSS